MDFEIFDERNEIAIASEEDDGVEFLRSGDGVNSESDIPVGLLGAPVEYLQVFRLWLDTDLGQSLEKAFFLTRLRRDHVGARTDEPTPGDRVLQDVAEIHTRMINVLRAVVEILRVDENADALFWMFDNCHSK